ncbi:MAG: hypothetical protein KJO28_06255, partial [Desulfofustis sp.]|nr:hypothetical protein [Desulfofustis sp.]
ESIASMSDGDDSGGEQGEMSSVGDTQVPGSGLTIEVLKKELQSIEGFEEISGDSRYQKFVDRLTRLGEASDFGKLVTAAIDEGGTSWKIIVPTQPTAVIRAVSSAVSQIEIAVQQKLRGDGAAV